jgi:hypothetical protein
MKRLVGFTSMLVLLAAPVFGGSNKPQTVVFPDTVQIGSTHVPAGTYELEWTGSIPEVQVTLTKAGKTVATFAAKAVEQKSNPSVGTYSNGGVEILESINLAKVHLDVEGAPRPGN